MCFVVVCEAHLLLQAPFRHWRKLPSFLQGLLKDKGPLPHYGKLPKEGALVLVNRRYTTCHIRHIIRIMKSWHAFTNTHIIIEAHYVFFYILKTEIQLKVSGSCPLWHSSTPEPSCACASRCHYSQVAFLQKPGVLTSFTISSRMLRNAATTRLRFSSVHLCLPLLWNPCGYQISFAQQCVFVILWCGFLHHSYFSQLYN